MVGFIKLEGLVRMITFRIEGVFTISIINYPTHITVCPTMGLPKARR
jgi:hypothetical protein